jgi:hypothetical protein
MQYHGFFCYGRDRQRANCLIKVRKYIIWCSLIRFYKFRLQLPGIKRDIYKPCGVVAPQGLFGNKVFICMTLREIVS